MEEVQRLRARIDEIRDWRHRNIQLPYEEARERAGCPVSMKYPDEVIEMNTRLVAEARELSNQLRVLFTQ